MKPGSADHVISEFYSAALQPQHWDNALAALTRLADGQAACCYVKDGPGETPEHHHLSGVDEGAWRDGYMRYYHLLDPGYGILQRVPAGVMYPMHRYVSDDMVKHSEYFQDFYLRTGLRYPCCGIVSHDGRVAILSVHRAPGQQHYQESAVCDLQRVLSHLPNVLRLRDLAQQAQTEPTLSFAALDMLPRAVVLADSGLRVQLMNRAAHVLLAHEPGLCLRGGMFGLQDAAMQQRLARAVRRVCCVATAAEPAPLHTVDANGRPALEICIAPLPVAQSGAAQPLAMLSLRRLFHAAIAARQAARPYGLSPAELAVAMALANGMAPLAYASEHGVRISTVRSQIQAILAKTGTRRSSEIAVLFSSLELAVQEG